MQDGTDLRAEPSEDRSRPVLEFVHTVLTRRGDAPLSLDAILSDLASAMGAEDAGFASLPGCVVVARSKAGRPIGKDIETVQVPSEVLAQAARTSLAIEDHSGGETSRLLAADIAPDGKGWLLWVDAPKQRVWTPGERAGLAIAAQAVGRQSKDVQTDPRWAKQQVQSARLRRLEDAALVTRRLSHDFGNVLTGILGFTELTLAQITPADAVYPLVKELLDAVRHGAEVTDHLRLFSRRNAKLGQPSDVVEALKIEESRLRQKSGAAWSLRIDVDSDLAPVVLNAEAMHSVLGNVLDNARESVKNGGAVVVEASEIQLTEADCLDTLGCPLPGAHVKVVVTDEGCGLSEEARQRLFSEPFFTDKPRHRGLGLAVVYGILQAHKGALLVEPRAEGGTQVSLFLPVAKSKETPASRRAAATGAVLGERVLVVDDDPMILRLCTATLEKAGYRVQTASTASEALDSYQAAGTEPFRLVVSDVVMPRMTGVDLARRLRRQDANVNVLLMSGQVSPNFPKEELEEGPFDFLPKPFRPEGLLSAVRSALDRPSQRLPLVAGGLG
jgi:signal transduction histidine kinase/ActR/RegA family two-component response regulator